jgi:hypothetical protein
MGNTRTKTRTTAARKDAATKMPLPWQPGFDLDAALAEEKRIAEKLPYGTIFISPATGGYVAHGRPITDKDVYDCY